VLVRSIERLDLPPYLHAVAEQQYSQVGQFAVATHGEEQLEADRKRPNKSSPIGLGETQFVKAGARSQRDWDHHRRGREGPPGN
jgi:hypothetical protein